MSNQALQTEFEFTLPQGYVDDDGTLHREGRMRLATAADEIEPLNDPRVQTNSSYLTIALLGRVVSELGTLESVDETVIENLFVGDLEYLQQMYERVNNQGLNTVETVCPDCGHVFDVDVETGNPVPSDTDAEMEFHPAAPVSEESVDGESLFDNAVEETQSETEEATAGNPIE